MTAIWGKLIEWEFPEEFWIHVNNPPFLSLLNANFLNFRTSHKYNFPTKQENVSLFSLALSFYAWFFLTMNRHRLPYLANVFFISLLHTVRYQQGWLLRMGSTFIHSRLLGWSAMSASSRSQCLQGNEITYTFKNIGMKFLSYRICTGKWIFGHRVRGKN